MRISDWSSDVCSSDLQAQGYERVKPPLLEFEEALLTGAGAAVASQTFRLMDPVSQRMMGLRADMTPKVARIATTRLTKAPRPLRLRSDEHRSEHQSLLRSSYADCCSKNKTDTLPR